MGCEDSDGAQKRVVKEQRGREKSQKRVVRDQNG